jgi:hypothetical protein
MTKTANITPALIRKVATPIELYENPPKVSPTILARPPKPEEYHLKINKNYLNE